jgi:hypothetical protein
VWLFIQLENIYGFCYIWRLSPAGAYNQYVNYESIKKSWIFTERGNRAPRSSIEQ